MKPQIANCSNCEYLYYDPNDSKESMLCAIARKYREFPKNPLAVKLMEKHPEYGEICEEYQPAQKFKDLVTYEIKCQT